MKEASGFAKVGFEFACCCNAGFGDGEEGFGGKDSQGFPFYSFLYLFCILFEKIIKKKMENTIK